jgi:hypothetical protein
MSSSLRPSNYHFMITARARLLSQRRGRYFIVGFDDGNEVGLMPPAPPNPKHPSDLDPALKAVHTADDPAFERGRRTAIDLLEPADATVLAFWLQAVGDGTPLLQARHDPAEQVLYH